MNDAVRLVAMVNETQGLDVEGLPSFVDVDSSSHAGQLVEPLGVVDDDFIVDLESDAAHAMTPLALQRYLLGSSVPDLQAVASKAAEGTTCLSVSVADFGFDVADCCGDGGGKAQACGEEKNFEGHVGSV